MAESTHKDQKPVSFDKSISSSSSRCAFMAIVIFLIFLSYFLYSFSFNSFIQSPSKISNSLHAPLVQLGSGQKQEDKTELKHIVFGIASSSKLWKHRSEYVKTWWKPDSEMKGAAWLEKPTVNENVSSPSSSALPEIRISSDTSNFKYRHRKGHRSAIRITRIVSDTVRMLNGTESASVRWIVMGDDDTVFFTENLVRVLRKYDHKQFYYIGAPSESHLQNLNHFSYGMAYGGGGFAISYPLAKALEKMQDPCIERYADLYGSDDRIHACMAELGVPLTREVGFHQFDVYGNLLGLLSVHPQAPIVSIHHLDVVEPIFPRMDRVKAVKRLMISAKLDSASLVQQSICYDTTHQWTMSVSWGYTVQITRTYMPARMMEVPTRTFNDWNKHRDFTNVAFNTRPITYTDCQQPRVFYMSRALNDSSSGTTISEYLRHKEKNPKCEWGIPDPSDINRIFVYKKSNPDRWNKTPDPSALEDTDISENKKKLSSYTVDAIFEKNFSLLGVGEGEDCPLLLKEATDVFKFYASGRRYCHRLLATLELKSRHDLISRLFNCCVPCKDEISFEVYMNDEGMDHVVFALARKKAAKVMLKEMRDLQRFGGCSWREEVGGRGVGCGF
ncbi:Uncharacterized protein HA466_0313300 [Hirschfeldia incana]|nr:Uncharacterized protein HA466_0313300 [Hirschfeldia incana]